MMIATASSRRRDLSIIRRVAVPGLNILAVHSTYDPGKLRQRTKSGSIALSGRRLAEAMGGNITDSLGFLALPTQTLSCPKQKFAICSFCGEAELVPHH